MYTYRCICVPICVYLRTHVYQSGKLRLGDIEKCPNPNQISAGTTEFALTS